MRYFPSCLLVKLSAGRIEQTQPAAGVGERARISPKFESMREFLVQSADPRFL